MTNTVEFAREHIEQATDLKDKLTRFDLMWQDFPDLYYEYEQFLMESGVDVECDYIDKDIWRVIESL